MKKALTWKRISSIRRTRSILKKEEPQNCLKAALRFFIALDFSFKLSYSKFWNTPAIITEEMLTEMTPPMTTLGMISSFRY